MGQQYHKGGQQGHEQRRSLLLAHNKQLLRQLQRKLETLRMPLKALHQRARIVSGQVQNGRQGGEPLLPVLKIRGEKTGLMIALPRHKIPVPDRHIWQRRGTPGAKCAI